MPHPQPPHQITASPPSPFPLPLPAPASLSHTRVPGRPSPLPQEPQPLRFTSPFHPALRKAPQPLIRATSLPAHTPLCSPARPPETHTRTLTTRQPSPCLFTTRTVTRPPTHPGAGMAGALSPPPTRSPSPPTHTYRSLPEPRPGPGPIAAEPLGEFRPPPSLYRRTSRAPPRAPRNPRPRAPHVTAQRRTTGQWRTSSLARPGQSRSVDACFPATAERRGGATAALGARSTASSPDPAPSYCTPRPLGGLRRVTGEDLWGGGGPRARGRA